jgi:Ras-related protein Rab-2A
MLQFTDKKFKNDNDPTIGVEFGSKTMDIRNKVVKLQIWDTAGQESFRSITRSYFRGAIGAILTFDITNRESFTQLNSFIEETSSCASQNLVLILVGNKSDLDANREVPKDEAENFASAQGLIYIETSAKTSENVDLCFMTLAEQVLERIENGQINPTDEVRNFFQKTFANFLDRN